MTTEGTANVEANLTTIPIESFMEFDQLLEPKVAKLTRLTGRKIGVIVGDGQPKLEDPKLEERLCETIDSKYSKPVSFPVAISNLNRSVKFKDHGIVFTSIGSSVLHGNFIERVLNGSSNCLENMLALKYIQLAKYPDTSFTIVQYDWSANGTQFPTHFGGVFSGKFTSAFEYSTEYDIGRGIEEVISTREFRKPFANLSETETTQVRNGIAEGLLILRNYRKKTGDTGDVFVIKAGTFPISSKMFEEYVGKNRPKLPISTD